MSVSRLMQMGASNKWTPLQLSIIDAWYDVSDYSTITETSGNVTALADKTSNNYDLSYAGTSPVYSSTGWDGSLPAIEFSLKYHRCRCCPVLMLKLLIFVKS